MLRLCASAFGRTGPPNRALRRPSSAAGDAARRTACVNLADDAVRERPIEVLASLVVVSREVPFRQDLRHLEAVLHPFERVGEAVAELRVALAEGVAAVADRILEGARLVACGELDRPFRMILEGGGEHRLIIDDAVDAADH